MAVRQIFPKYKHRGELSITVIESLYFLVRGRLFSTFRQWFLFFSSIYAPVSPVTHRLGKHRVHPPICGQNPIYWRIFWSLKFECKNLNVFYETYIMKSFTYPICRLSTDLWTNFWIMKNPLIGGFTLSILSWPGVTANPRYI